MMPIVSTFQDLNGLLFAPTRNVIAQFLFVFVLFSNFMPIFEDLRACLVSIFEDLTDKSEFRVFLERRELFGVKLIPSFSSLTVFGSAEFLAKMLPKFSYVGFCLL